MAVKSNREILSGGKSYKQKAAKKFGADEVTFDKDSRLEYLTGFHKRKVERQKKAKDFIQEQERKMRIEERAKVREEKKKVMEKQLADFKQSMKDVGDYLGSDAEEDKAGSDEEKADVDEEEWNGFSGEEQDSKEDQEEMEDGQVSVKPILKKYVQTYQDETTVDIEPLEPNENFEYLAQVNNVKLEQSEKILDQSIERAKKYAKFLGVDDKPKPKKNKKFRYLTKAERKQNQKKANSNKRR